MYFDDYFLHFNVKTISLLYLTKPEARQMVWSVTD